MTTLVGAAGVALLLVVPHVTRLDEAPPMSAAVVWLWALLLRAVLSVLAALCVVLILPTTEVFRALTHWCWHTVLPLIAARTGFDGHAVGDAAMLVPLLALVLSVMSVAIALLRAARAVRRLLRATIADGPLDSLIVQDRSIMVAAAGLRHPKVLVSAGALMELSDDELYASLDHEQGHIRRRHRWLLVAGEIARALGRLLPGTAHAARELAFHLERDADRYALERRHEPAALAQAICKAAVGAAPGVSVLRLNGGGTVRRVRQLLDPPPPRATLTARLLAAGIVSATLALMAVVPPAALAAAQHPVPAHPVHDCPQH